jgi:hypothetical protein
MVLTEALAILGGFCWRELTVFWDRRGFWNVVSWVRGMSEQRFYLICLCDVIFSKDLFRFLVNPTVLTSNEL